MSRYALKIIRRGLIHTFKSESNYSHRLKYGLNVDSAIYTQPAERFTRE
ncbi:hypothetical protein KEJ35_03830 [Candidatus Bathyarchaeota archaeon]|nr:hypothetical protein [Candidatus Bathyarchaeota archaeon]